MRVRRVLALFTILVLALTPVFGATPPAAAATPTAAATPAAGTPAVSACLGNDALCAKPGTAAARALAEQLAQKYAPVMYLKTQTGPCDDKGEPYLPSPVDIVLNDPQVVLRKNMGGYDNSRDPIVKTGPTAQDLAGKDSTYYLDLPGDPREPGCTYERFSKERMAGQQPVTYAHVAFGTDAAAGSVTVQYWFYYAFNRFNNLHESDWEMIQLLFDVPSLEEALTLDGPDELAYAQHEGGELGAWGDDKVSIEDGHPVVYPASGSHATYYGSSTYIGWGERGSGLGCDVTTGSSTRVVPEVRLLPDQPDPTGPYAWLTFAGHWGEKDRFPFDGPTGPNAKVQWSDPLTWEGNLRASSLAIGNHQSFGPNPAGLFCNAVGFVSGLYSDQKNYAWYSYSVVALLVLVPLLFFLLTRRVLFAAVKLMARHTLIFLPIGLALIVIGAAATYIDAALDVIPWLRGTVNAVLSLASPSQFIFFTGSNAMVEFVGWTLVTPAVIYVTAQIKANRQPSVRAAIRFGFSRFWTLIKATVRITVTLVLLSVTIVGIPFALIRLIRWSLANQAVLLDGANWRDAGRVSAQSVRGRWWRTLIVLISVGFIITAIAPVVGIVVLVFIDPSVFVANAVSGAVYALTFPFAGVVTALWYLERRGEPESPETAPLPAAPSGIV